jgi:hypothetical protein
MNKIIAILFALTCFATSALSNSIMGAGMWFWVIIVAGAFVAVSQFYPLLRGAGAGLAMLLAAISFLAVLLGLLVATVGGSFKMDGSSAGLLVLFFISGVLGVTLGVIHKRYVKLENEMRG